jgi:hypothetical protein
VELPRPQAIPLPPEPSPEELTPLTLREKLARTVVALGDAQAWAKKLFQIGGGLSAGGLGLAILFFTLFFSQQPSKDVVPLFVLGCVSAGIGVSVGPSLLIVGVGMRHLAQSHSHDLKRLARKVADLYPAAVPLGVEVTRWDVQTGWDVIHYLDDHHVRKGVNARLVFSGQWLQKHSFKVFLDGRLLGTCDTKKGFDFRVNACVGTHQVHIKWDAEISPLLRRFDLTKEGQCEVEVDCKMPQQGLLKVEVNYR